MKMDPNQPVYAAEAYPVPPDIYAATAMPSAPPTAPPPMPTRQATVRLPENDNAIRSYLEEYGWPVGLQSTFIHNLNRVPIRFFICDDSGSMTTADGKTTVRTGPNSLKQINCARWTELTTALKFHAGLARVANAPTEFRLLNGAPPIMIGDGDDLDNNKFNTLNAIFDHSPGGGTPLCRHIYEVTEQLRHLAPGLRAAGQKAVVMIATDGESSDGNIAEALRPLKDLPVWVVIRLCTDEDKIVDYWNNVDNELELDMDVLDDIASEAKEVFDKNPWLAYGEPLHRIREFGIPVKEIDLLDEASLTLDQVRAFCSFM
jgi:hypothetical protein